MESPPGPYNATTEEEESALHVVSFSWSIPLAEEIEPGHAVYVQQGQTKTGCPGTVAEPQADAGYLCVYHHRTEEEKTAEENGETPETTPLGGPFPLTEEIVAGALGEEDRASRTGALLLIENAGAKGHGATSFYGSFAVTAPVTAP